MAIKLIKNRDAINTLVVLGWRKLPAIVGLTGKFPLLLTAVDTDRIPKADPGTKPWGRYILSIGNGYPTAISARRWRVDGSLKVQILARATKSNATDLVEKCGQFLAEWISGYRGEVVFTEVSALTRPQSKGFALVEVSAKFRWDETRGKIPDAASGDSSQGNSSDANSFMFTDDLEVITDDDNEPVEV